jgi:hypothetical protein
MSPRSAVVVALSLLLGTAPLQAQVPILDFRFGAHAAMPTGDLADTHAAGFGIYGRVGAPVGPMKLMGSFTWNLLAGEGGIEDVDIITVQAGPHFTLLPLIDVGLEAGYFTEVSEVGLAPNVSLRLMRFDVTASYNTTFGSEAINWLTLGGGLRF